MTKHYATEKPYVVTTKSGTAKSYHYTPRAAIDAAKAGRGHRNIHGLHRGDWKLLLSYRKGIRL